MPPTHPSPFFPAPQGTTVSQFIEDFLGYKWSFRWWTILIMGGESGPLPPMHLPMPTCVIACAHIKRPCPHHHSTT